MVLEIVGLDLDNTRRDNMVTTETKYKPLDVVVAGTGRSGTSFAAMCLGTQFGICMTHKPELMQPKLPAHRWGAWEPANSRKKVKFTMATLGHVPPKVLKPAQYKRMAEILNDLHRFDCTAELVGAKSPTFGQLTREQWKQFVDDFNIRFVVWAYRPPKVCIKSFNTKYKRKTPIVAAERVKLVNTTLERMKDTFEDHEPPVEYVKIDFTEEMEIETFCDIVRPYIEKLK